MTLGYPANIPAGPGHNWANAMAMATPIAHKGVTAGAKAQAMTALDLLMRPELVTEAWDYFNERPDQGREVHAADPARGQAGDLAEQADDGEVSAGDEEVLLRPDEVQDLSRAVGDQVPYGSLNR